MIPAWTLFFFIPGMLSAIMPWIIGLSALCLGYLVIAAGLLWVESLLVRAAKALPACWLFDGRDGPPVTLQRVAKDGGPACNDYHSFDGWIEAYKAWEAGKPIPFNAHNKSWRYGNDTY